MRSHRIAAFDHKPVGGNEESQPENQTKRQSKHPGIQPENTAQQPLLIVDFAQKIHKPHDPACFQGVLLNPRSILIGIESTNLQVEREDLRFQMAQLKGRLGTINAESTLAKDAVHDETSKLDSEIQSKLDAIIPIAEQIVSHFIQDPSLRPILTTHLSSPPPSR